MRVLFVLCFIPIILLLFAPAAFAWQSETHSALAEKVCRDFNCSCIPEIRDAAVVPDRDFRDNIRHHCYDLTVPCVSSEYYECPKKNDCPALRKAEEFLDSAEMKDGCARWRDIGIASHYFFDSKVFWHKTQGEDYYKCHAPFEGKVEKKFEAKDGSNWTIGQCGATENYGNLVQYVAEFEDVISARGEVKSQDAPLLPECGFWCRFWGFIAQYLRF